jgi:hypothetical protein
MVNTYFDLWVRCRDAAGIYYAACIAYNDSLLGQPLTSIHAEITEDYRYRSEVYLAAINDCLTYLESGNRGANKEIEFEHLQIFKHSVKLVLANI